MQFCPGLVQIEVVENGVARHTASKLAVRVRKCSAFSRVKATFTPFAAARSRFRHIARRQVERADGCPGAAITTAAMPCPQP